MDKSDPPLYGAADPPTEKTQPTRPAPDGGQGPSAAPAGEPTPTVGAAPEPEREPEPEPESEQFDAAPVVAATPPASAPFAADGPAWAHGHPVPLLDRLDKDQIKDLLVRASKVAGIVFCAWFSVALLLIAVFRFVNPPITSLMVLKWLGGAGLEQEWVPLESISPNLRRAVIVSEDGRFCRHWGIDFGEIAAALKRTSNGVPRGASTITMQVAKNLFLWPAKSYVRKVLEVPLTYAIELMWPKRRILEVYLNIAEWGPGIFGAEAGARAHFSRSARRLNGRQAALLAVALPNPRTRNAGRPGSWTSRRATVIQRRAAHAQSAASCAETGG